MASTRRARRTRAQIESTPKGSRSNADFFSLNTFKQPKRNPSFDSAILSRNDVNVAANTGDVLSRARDVCLVGHNLERDPRAFRSINRLITR